MKKRFLHLVVLSLLVLPLSAGAIYDPEAEISDTDGMQNRARIQMNADEAEPMLLMEGSEANESASENAIGRVQENWQNRVDKLKAKKNEISTKLQAKRSNQNKGELQELRNQYQEQVRTEFQQFKGEMKDAVKERYENWQNTLDKKFDKWEARLEDAMTDENSDDIKFLQTEISRLKDNVVAGISALEASRQSIASLQDSEDQSLWVAEHQAEWQMHKDNLKALRDNMSSLNSYLRQLKDLLQ